MTLTITHNKVATLPDQAGNEINKAEWNDSHAITGAGALASQDTITVSQISNATIAAASVVSGSNTGDQNLAPYAPLASPTFTGTVGGITAAMVGAPSGSGTSTGSNTGDQNLAPYITSATAASTYAPLASPALTGTPTVPTAANGTNSTQVATTAYVDGSNAALQANGILCGTGQDGNVTISSGTTTLARDMYYANLTITGGSLVPNGFRFFWSGTLDLSAAPAGAIKYNGGNGNNASGTNGATGGGASSTSSTNSTITIASSGAAAVNGGTGNGANANTSSAVAALNIRAGALGGAGGTGNAGATTGGTGAAGATPTQASFPYSTLSALNIKSPVAILPGGAPSNGAAGGGDGVNNGGGGGGAPLSGGSIVMAGNIIALGSNANAGVIQSKGGTGGNGGTCTTGNCGGGGGAPGGQGGTIIIIYNTKTGSITNGIDVTGGTGGAGGTKIGTGVNGNGGGGGPGGYVLQINAITGAIAEFKGPVAVAAATGGTTTGVGATSAQTNL